MADVITVQDMENAKLDAVTLEEVANGSSTQTVVSRLGQSMSSVAKVIYDMQAVNFTGDWTASTQYFLKDIVRYNNVLFVCIVGHTSGPSIELANWTPYRAFSASVHPITGEEIIPADSDLLGSFVQIDNFTVNKSEGKEVLDLQVKLQSAHGVGSSPSEFKLWVREYSDFDLFGTVGSWVEVDYSYALLSPSSGTSVITTILSAVYATGTGASYEVKVEGKNYTVFSGGANGDSKFNFRWF